MADVNIKYKGVSIATMDTSGSKTLQTSGKYCEDDIAVEYTDPEKPTQTKSATPAETAQDITPDSGKVLSKVSVGAIPKTYVGSGVTKKAAATVSPSTSEQTVCAGGVYTTGAQKVAAITKELLAQLDPDFAAANIKKDVDLFGLVGTLEAGGGGNGVSGTYVVASSETIGIVPSKALKIATGLPEVTFFAFVLDKNCAAESREMAAGVWARQGDTYFGRHYELDSDSSYRNYVTDSNSQYTANGFIDNGGTMQILGMTTSSKVVAGHRYIWFAL